MNTLANHHTPGSGRRARLFGAAPLAALLAALLAPLAAFAQPPQAPVNLRSATPFGVLAASLISSIPLAAITGDVGLSPATGGNITGMSSGNVTGTIYTVDATGPAGSTMDPTRLTAAQGDLTIAYNDAAGRTPIPAGPFLNPGSGNIGGLTLIPGLYKFTSTLSITGSDVTLTGSDTSVWIFQIATDLVVGNGIQVILAGGAQARNIFWQVGTSATLGTTAAMKGTILADQSISMNTGATLTGRALARIAAVTLASNTITLPSKAPGAPRNVTGVGGSAQISVSWLAPLSDSGSVVVSYKATAVQDSSKHCTTAGALTCNVTGLTGGVPYTFTVRAVSAAGMSAASAPSNAATTGILTHAAKEGLDMRVSGSGVVFHFPAGTTDIRVSVTDMHGRNVWSRSAGNGARDLAWNGVATSGRRAAPGIYMVRASIAHPDARIAGTRVNRVVLAP